MTCVWSHRPQSLHLGLFIAAYVLGSGFAQSLAIVPGTGISIWPPGGLFMATLILASRHSWPWWVLGGLLAELFSNFLWFHSPLPAAVLIYAGNALEAAAGAWLVIRISGRPVRLETLPEVLAFVVLGAGIAPVISATVGSATLAWFGIQSQSFTTAWPLWWIGDATGVLIVAPLALVVLQNWRGKAQLSAAQWMEACVLGLIFLGVAALSLSGYLPFAYIIMPPLLWAAVRFEFKGAAVSLTLLALITAVFTISGASQFAGDPESQKHKQVMLQLFLAVSAFSALIVAAISRQHQLAVLTLRQSVEALRDRERELSQLVDMVPSLLWRLSPEGEPTFFNQRLINFLGLDMADADKPGMSRLAAIIEAAVHPDDAASLREALNHSFVTGERFSKTYRLRRADGVYRWVEGSAEPLRDESGRILQWYGLSHDIDDQLRVEEALRRSERQLQQLIDTVPVQIWCITPGGEPAYINKTMMDYIGLKLEDFDAQQGLAGAIQTIVHPDDRIPLQRALNHSFSTGEAFELKFRNRRSDGSYRWTEGRAEPLRDESGRIIRWFGANVDIHDFVTSQEALQERERFLWELVETLPAMIDCAAPNGEPVYRSQQLREFLGYELEELDGTGKSRLAGTLDAGVHPDDVAGVKERYAHSLSTGEPYARKHRLRRFDGEYRWVNTRAAAMRNAEGAIVQWNVICLDIDGEVRAQEELRLAQESLARASQAASLAELSASIAHEVNQPLAAVVANSHACQRWLTAEPPNLERAQKTVERIIRDANAAAAVVSRIRALFKQSVETRHATTLDSVIAEARDLTAEEAARRRVRMDVDVESNLPPVALDRVQIQQVLVNLIRNGMEAMDTITTDRVLRIRARRMGNAVETEISDRGRGVESPDKIFEPFFSTKEHGMGMGLAICRSIVESHGGRLWAEKNQPHGATFVFTLPVEVKASP
ncbi:MASE1 domain-containing protein [Sinorhizobium numidicum]|uniref:histidine kinase n=1 Tax=Sinorhizobium numidicum TaxID=680248 RepID=A0ABY8CPT4_9HYPH|nr:MASE1 domain-containing protein [Sinorhizobium numidicum]WEX74677.1 MASE1 domain-containing protein [Sinorhizobium numidicum]WEX80669.1 MASE1 domain-containing protein [Sinorhizobium numidicum]